MNGTWRKKHCGPRNWRLNLVNQGRVQKGKKREWEQVEDFWALGERPPRGGGWLRKWVELNEKSEKGGSEGRWGIPGFRVGHEDLATATARTKRGIGAGTFSVRGVKRASILR